MSCFNHKIVRDLEFVIGAHTPLPVDHSQIIQESFDHINEKRHASWLSILDEDPSLLKSFLQGKPNHILGRYFENLVLFWLQNSPFYEVLISQEQIINGGVTTSEIDFIVRSLEDDYIYHIECAFKVYMRFDEDKWIGPNAKDSLEKKMRTAFDKQQVALFSEDGLKQLEHVGIENPDEVKFMLFLKAYFFEPLTNNQKDSEEWCHLQQLDSFDGKQSIWVILPKPYWMTPVILSPNELSVMSWNEVLAKLNRHFMSDHHAVLLARVQKRHGLYYETKRLFVVSNNWPN